MKSVRERFWSKVNKTETCWLWIGALSNDGYGYFWNGKGVKAHRASLEFHGIEISSGMVVDHICRVHNCVNPNHLRVVTKRENSLENSVGATATNNVKTHCPKGHLLSGDNLDQWELKRGRRKCYTCQLAQVRRWNKRQKEVRNGQTERHSSAGTTCNVRAKFG